MVISQIKEALRDKTRDNLCAALCSMGVRAQLAERGRPEEWRGDGPGNSLGIIDVAEGPIRWVNVRRWREWGGEPRTFEIYWDSEARSLRMHTVPFVFRIIEYGVPDERALPRARIRSRRLKKVASLVGSAGVRWEGEDSGLGLIDRLTADPFIDRVLIQNRRDLNVYASGRYWIISEQYRSAPWLELWRCYESIARHLLAGPQLSD